jgi:Mrp family chromosome partitioning ATPase
MTQQGFKRFRRRVQRPSPGSGADQVSVQESTSGQAGFVRSAEEAGHSASAHLSERQAAYRSDIGSETPLSLPAKLPPLWDRLPQIPFDPDHPVGASVPLVSTCRSAPAARAFDLLRTRLLQTLKARSWRCIAICAPSSDCGATFTAVNLALSLARVPSSRTLLMDLNFRAPGVASALGLAAEGDLPAFLAGNIPVEDALVRPLDTLALGLNTVRDENAAEILHGRRCADVLDDMIRRTEVETVLFDLPPLLEFDDAAAFLPQVDGVLLVSDGTRTTAAQLAACESILAGQVPLLGVLLNRGRGANVGAAVA